MHQALGASCSIYTVLSGHISCPFYAIYPFLKFFIYLSPFIFTAFSSDILDDDCKYIIVKEPSHISFPITDICTLLFMIIRKRTVVYLLISCTYV